MNISRVELRDRSIPDLRVHSVARKAACLDDFHMPGRIRKNFLSLR
jgi:hypothetical protein